MTYSARRYEPVRAALAAAIDRAVAVDVVVETLSGAGSALSGSEPATAFAGLHGLNLWHWPTPNRTTAGAKMHAKLAVADGKTLLVSSANLTQSGVSDSLEAGLLVRGGAAPQRALEYVRDLQARGLLRRLNV
jgi:phosphatidylserine/phosphatidylglycerophosphate/cardiolipin synthase-like enzyme